MRTIFPPPANIQPSDHFAACKHALEPALWQVIDRANTAGWPKHETLLAAIVLLKEFAEQEAQETAGWNASTSDDRPHAVANEH